MMPQFRAWGSLLLMACILIPNRAHADARPTPCTRRPCGAGDAHCAAGHTLDPGGWAALKYASTHPELRFVINIAARYLMADGPKKHTPEELEQARTQGAFLWRFTVRGQPRTMVVTQADLDVFATASTLFGARASLLPHRLRTTPVLTAWDERAWGGGADPQCTESRPRRQSSPSTEPAMM